MQIFVYTLSGHTYTIEIERSDTIETLKDKIHNYKYDIGLSHKSFQREKQNETPKEIIENPKMKNGPPPEQQRIMFARM